MNLKQRFQNFILRSMLRAKVLTIQDTNGVSAEFRARRFNEFYKEAYRHNPIVYACLRVIGNGLCAVPIGIEYEGEIVTQDDIAPRVKPLYNLVQRFNPNQGYHEFIALWSNQLHLAGITYIEGIGIGKRTTNGKTQPKTAPEMYLELPDRVTIETTDNRTVSRYVIETGIGNKRYLTPDEMYNVKFTDPAHPMFGLSPLNAAATDIDTSNLQLAWNSKLLTNSAVPGGVLQITGWSSLTPQVRARIEQDYNDKFSGASNAGATAFIDGEKSNYMALAHSPKEMDWTSGAGVTMRHICAALGVPSQLVGDDKSSTYNNVESAERFLYENTVLPLHRLFREEFAEFVLPKMGLEDDVKLLPIVSGINALQDNVTERVHNLANSDWMTPNEKREASGLEMIEPDDPDNPLNKPYIRLPDTLKQLQPEEIGVDTEENETKEAARAMRSYLETCG